MDIYKTNVSRQEPLYPKNRVYIRDWPTIQLHPSSKSSWISYHWFLCGYTLLYFKRVSNRLCVAWKSCWKSRFNARTRLWRWSLVSLHGLFIFCFLASAVATFLARFALNCSFFMAMKMQPIRFASRLSLRYSEDVSCHCCSIHRPCHDPSQRHFCCCRHWLFIQLGSSSLRTQMYWLSMSSWLVHGADCHFAHKSGSCWRKWLNSWDCPRETRATHV